MRSVDCASSEFSSAFARAPGSGTYLYIYATLGELPALMVGWLVSLSCCVAGGVAVRACAGYIDNFLASLLVGGSSDGLVDTVRLVTQNYDLLGGSIQVNLFAPMLGAGLTSLLLRGAEDSALLNKVLAVVNVCLLIFFSTTGWLYSDSANWFPAVSPDGAAADGSTNYSQMLSGVLAATGTVYYSYVGFDAVCLVSGEAKDPARGIPTAMLSSILLVFLIYGGVALALTGMQPPWEIDADAPLASAFLSKQSPFLNFA